MNAKEARKASRKAREDKAQQKRKDDSAMVATMEQRVATQLPEIIGVLDICISEAITAGKTSTGQKSLSGFRPVGDRLIGFWWSIMYERVSNHYRTKGFRVIPWPDSLAIKVMW
jgi:hypothetical protein